MDRRPPGVATIVVDMRIVTFGRTAVPLSVVVLAVAGYSAPAVALESMVVITVIGAIGLIIVGLTRRWQESRRVCPQPRMDRAVQIAKDDASDLGRMGSDAG